MTNLEIQELLDRLKPLCDQKTKASIEIGYYWNAVEDSLYAITELQQKLKELTDTVEKYVSKCHFCKDNTLVLSPKENCRNCTNASFILDSICHPPSHNNWDKPIRNTGC